MMTTPLVSVVLPVYNGASTIDEAIQSIVAQTFSNWELIVVDDDSQDASFERLQHWQATDRRIRAEKNPHNIGLAATMNVAVRLATGQYIAVQEQDDMSPSDRLAAEVAFLESHPHIGLVSGIADWLDDNLVCFSRFPGLLVGGQQYPQDCQAMFEFLYTEQCKVVNAGCAFRRSIIENCDKPFNEQARMSIDWEFFLRISRQYKIWGLPQTVIRMRRGAGHPSLTRQKVTQFREARRLINDMRREFGSAETMPIRPGLWRLALSNQYLLEARYWGGVKGCHRLLLALLLAPRNPTAWDTVRWYRHKLTRKFSR